MTTSIADLLAALGPAPALIALGVILVNGWIMRISVVVWIQRSYLRWTPSQRRDVRELIHAMKGRRGGS